MLLHARTTTNKEDNTMYEETFVLVKPDGIQKGADKIIRDQLERLNLEIVLYKCVNLRKEWVAQLYKEHKGQDYYFKTIKWLSSSPVIIMRVKGESAIWKAKFQVIGRYPNGIRGQLAESNIKNVAHASESAVAAKRELELAEPLFYSHADTITTNH